MMEYFMEGFISCFYALFMFQNAQKLVVFYYFFLVEIDDLKKITNSLTVLCSEKQKQEKVGENYSGKVNKIGWGCRQNIPKCSKLLKTEAVYRSLLHLGQVRSAAPLPSCSES